MFILWPQNPIKKKTLSSFWAPCCGTLPQAHLFTQKWVTKAVYGFSFDKKPEEVVEIAAQCSFCQAKQISQLINELIIRINNAGYTITIGSKHAFPM